MMLARPVLMGVPVGTRVIRRNTTSKPSCEAKVVYSGSRMLVVEHDDGFEEFIAFTAQERDPLFFYIPQLENK